MKKLCLLIIISGILLTSCQEKKESNKHAITIGVVDSVYSSTLKEQRKIWVYVPDASTPSDYLPQKYPVIYLLDGDSHFASVTAMADYLSNNNVCPQMIIVGIPNTDRSRDLTPTRSLLLPDGGGPQDFLKTTGGAEQFTTFIEKELMPYIDAHYPTAPNKTLIGHSFGGLFAVNTLIHHPALFDSFVAIDPSMWWDGRKLLQHADTVLKSADLGKKNFFLSIANTMEPGMDTMMVTKDTSGNSEHIRSILTLARQVINSPKNGLRSDWKYYDNDDHGSVPFVSEYDALHFIFSYYKPKADDSKINAEFLTAHFKGVSEHLGYTAFPPERIVNELAYWRMSQKKWDTALGLLTLNTQNYPTSSNAFDSMGDYYLNRADSVKAKAFYKQSLSIKKTSKTEKKLENLDKKKI